jgi:hypothetical protein
MTQQFIAVGKFSDGSAADLTDSVSWSTSDETKGLFGSAPSAVEAVSNYGAVADSKLGYQCDIASGQTQMVCHDIQCAGSDAGSTVFEYGSNAASHYLATPDVTVTGCSSTGGFILSAAATRAVSSGFVQVIGAASAANTAAFQQALTAACAAGNTTVQVDPGVYSVDMIHWPVPCNGVTLSGNGQATLIQSHIVSESSSDPNYGLSGELLVIGENSDPGHSNNSAGHAIAAGTNQLLCPSCGWTSNDVGSPIYVQSAGPGGLPLWGTITAVDPGSGAATLSVNASTTLPLPVTPVNPPEVIWGFASATNITIDSIGLQDVSYYFESGFSRIAIPVLNMGAFSVDVKRGVTIRDVTIASAGSGCYGNNGPLDQFVYSNDVCRGATDAAWYFSGKHSNGTVIGMTADNTGWPYPNTDLFQCWLIKGSASVDFESPKGKCAVSNYIMNIGDAPNAGISVNHLNFDGTGVSHGGIQINSAEGVSIQGGTIQNLPAGNAIFLNNAFGANAVDQVKVINVGGVNVENALAVYDASSTGHGASNITFTGNTFSTTGNGANIQHVEGTNLWQGNTFTGSGQGAGWQISSGSTPGTNTFCQNSSVNYSSPNILDSTVECSGSSANVHARGVRALSTRAATSLRPSTAGSASASTQPGSVPGLYSAKSSGVATITATSGTISGTAQINVE